MIYVLTIIVLVFLTYAPTWKFHLIVDDVRHIAEVKKRTELQKHISFFKQWPRRVFFYGAGSLWRAGVSDEVNVKVDHIFQTVLHAVACVLIYFVFGATNVSFIAALLYAVNPVNVHTAIWLNGRRYLTNTILILLMLMAGPWGIALYPLTMSLQITAVFAPVLIFGWAAIPAAAVAAVVFRKRIKRHADNRLAKIHSPTLRNWRDIRRVVPILKCYGFYFRKIFLPGTVNIINPDMYYWGMTKAGNLDAYKLNRAFWAGAGAFGASVLALAIFRGDAYIFNLLLFFTLTLLVPSVLGFTVMQGNADRYVSAAVPIGMFFLANAVVSVFSAPVAAVILTAVFVYYLTHLWPAFRIFVNLDSFYQYHIYNNPFFSPIISMYATTKILRGDPMSAWALLADGLKYNPHDFNLNVAAAECSHVFQDLRGVRHFLSIAEQNYYEGHQPVMSAKIRNIKIASGLDKVEDELEKIRNKTSTLSANERKHILEKAGITT